MTSSLGNRKLDLEQTDMTLSRRRGSCRQSVAGSRDGACNAASCCSRRLWDRVLILYALLAIIIAGATGDELSSKVVTSTSYEMDGVARDAIRESHVNAPESTSDSVYYCTGTSLVCSTHSGRMKWEIDLSEFSGCRGRPILLEAQAKVVLLSEDWDTLMLIRSPANIFQQPEIEKTLSLSHYQGWEDMEFDGEMSLDVYNGVIYANAGGSGLFAVDADNLKLIWGDTKGRATTLRVFPEGRSGVICGEQEFPCKFGGVPAFDTCGAMYIANADGYVYSLNPQTGMRWWRTDMAIPSAGYIHSSCTVLMPDGSLAVTVNSDRGGHWLVSIDPATGDKRWAVQLPGSLQENHLCPVPAPDGSATLRMTGGCLEFISQSGNRLPPYCPKAEVERTATHSEYPAAPKALEMRHRLNSIVTTDVLYRTSCGDLLVVDMWIVTLRDTHPHTTSITEHTRWEVTVEILSREEGYGSPWRLKSQHLLDKMVEAIPEATIASPCSATDHGQAAAYTLAWVPEGVIAQLTYEDPLASFSCYLCEGVIPREAACTRKLNAAAVFVDDEPADLRALKPDIEAANNRLEEDLNNQGSSMRYEGAPESNIEVPISDTRKIDMKLLIWLLCFVAAILLGTAIAVLCCCLPPSDLNDYPLARDDGATETHVKGTMETEVDLIDAELNRLRAQLARIDNTLAKKPGDYQGLMHSRWEVCQLLSQCMKDKAAAIKRLRDQEPSDQQQTRRRRSSSTTSDDGNGRLFTKRLSLKGLSSILF